MSEEATRRIWLCADDYGIAPGVSAAIRDLIARGRLNATSAMVVAPGFTWDKARPLVDLNAGRPRTAIGLHVTLTAPFAPLSAGYAPVDANGAFLSLPATLLQAMARRLNAKALRVEVEMQFAAFHHTFGRMPDFVDGHQHVHLFPQVRDCVLATMQSLTPHAWVRQCGRPSNMPLSLSDPKGILIDRLSVKFRRLAAQRQTATNSGFAGTYAFREDADFAGLFPGFLEGLEDGAVVMCHPGFVDAELARLDPVTTLREREYAYLAGDTFLQDLAAAGVSLATPPV
jgi:predicted glycoside hydrolase/deacetylase ChbG (UPF0249 family)